VSSDEIGVGRRSLILIRHGTGYHLAVLLSHNVSSPFCSSVLKPNLCTRYCRNDHVIVAVYYNIILTQFDELPVALVWTVQSFEPAVSSPWRLGFG